MELPARERGFACNPLHIMSNAISVTRVSRDDSDIAGIGRIPLWARLLMRKAEPCGSQARGVPRPKSVEQRGR
jgi:hypothetical protein